MIEIKDLIMPVVSMGGLGVAFGGLLAFASQKFEVKNDPRADEINAVLPAANCGGCGYPGCMNYAIAVVGGEAVNKCTVGGPKVAEQVAAIMGVDAVDASERMVARVHCNGGVNAIDEYDYQGILSCRAMNLVSGGPKACKNGCLGCGDCKVVCQFGAIELKDGVAKIIPENCTGCQACVKACPKQIIKMIPATQNVIVDCMNTEFGGHVKKNCSVACIACKKCEKTCRFDAIHVINNVAVIDYDKCTDCMECWEVCPTGSITANPDFKVVAEVIDENCIGCTICAKNCPTECISGELKQVHKVNQDECIGCKICYEKCPKDAIALIPVKDLKKLKETA